MHYQNLFIPGVDTKLAFISSHLPSDSKGKSKWEKRDSTAQ